MGQRGFQNLYNSGNYFYWKYMYFINLYNWNWMFQEKIIYEFCTYLCIWLQSVQMFLKQITVNKNINFTKLVYSYKYMSISQKAIPNKWIWIFTNQIFRYQCWIIIIIDYYKIDWYKRQNKYRNFKKMRKLLCLS